MQKYVAHRGCLMEFLARALDDPDAKPCGVCANCQGKGFRAETSAELVNAGRRVPGTSRHRARTEETLAPGYDLSRRRRSSLPSSATRRAARCVITAMPDGVGWSAKANISAADSTINWSRLLPNLFAERWQPEPFPEWVTAIPSRRHPRLVYDFASRLANSLGIPFVAALVRSGDALEQKLMANSSMQARNVAGYSRYNRTDTGRCGVC